MEIVFDISQDELPVFLAEVDEQLQVLDEHLVQLEQADEASELLQELFRAAHTIKGMTGMIGHNRMMRLTHELETLFDGLRKGSLQMSTPLIDLCLDSVDGLRLLREEVVSGEESGLDVESLLKNLKNYTSFHLPEAATSSGQGAAAASVTGTGDDPTRRKLFVQANIVRGSVASAARAFQLMLALQEHGEIIRMNPGLQVIETAAPVSDFSAEIYANHSEDEIRRSIDQISEIESFSVTCPAGAQSPQIQPPQASAAVVEAASGKKADGEALVKEQPKNRERRGDTTVRTSVERLDTLMNLVGELITDRNHLYQLRNKMHTQAAVENSTDPFAETIAHLGRITDQLQESVMRIRMLPVGNVLSKFPRMVRDLSQKTGKLVDLVIEGEDTEMDRSMIEEINDPLIHLVRNSVDHGIELPQERIAAGKPERGTVWLKARYEQGRIIITIEDDGKGIDAEKVRASAVEKGLISKEEANALSEEQAIELIFLPGLSTVKQISDISGRGVGMDIVHTNIQRVNGMIQVETRLGKGTIFHITLPLTLAIVPTLMIRVRNTTYAIPLVMVSETLRLTKKDIKTVNGKPVTLLRGNVLPLADLGQLFCHPPAANTQQHIYAVVVNSGKMHAGIIVDALNGEEEVVVKSLGPLIGEVPGISSAAIMGDGSVALIVDVPGLFKIAGVH